MNNTFYFQHDYNAKNDQKILELRAEYGAEGYGIWWMLLETLAEQEEGINRETIGGLSLAFGINKKKLTEIIDFCLQVGLFYESNGYIRNSRMDEHKNWRVSLSKAGKKGNEVKWGRGKNIGGRSGGDRKERTGKERKGQDRTGKNSKSCEQVKLESWLKENYPELAKLKHPTVKDMKKLKVNYGQKAVEDILLRMNNYKLLLKKYKEVYSTALNWLKKDYGELKYDENGELLKPKSNGKPQVRNLR